MKAASWKFVSSVRLQSDPELESALKEKFGLKDVFVVITSHHSGERLTRTLGNAGAQMLTRYLAPQKILGLAWGTSISATVDAFEVYRADASSKWCNWLEPWALTTWNTMDMTWWRVSLKNLAARLITSMLLISVRSAEMAKSLLETKSIRETISVGKKTDVALLGIGTTSPDYSSFYLAGYITRRELDDLRKAGAIGDVCGLHFDMNGQPACDDFCERLVSIRRQDLLSIPVRLGVAGGEGKADAILGALRSKYVNVLVIDSMTARKVLELAKSK